MDYKIFWTEEAIRNLEDILLYLEQNWTQKEIELISSFPKMFPVSEYNPRLRNAVLSKQTTLFYELKGNTIYLIYLFVNYQDIQKIK